jgi:hydrogenase maturation protease
LWQTFVGPGLFNFSGEKCLMTAQTITIMGLGNILMQDEGVGVHAVKAFQERYSVPEYVELVDGGTAGLDLLEYFEGRDKVLIVDAVDFGRGPGHIDTLENEAIPARFGAKASMHHLGLMEVISVTRLLDAAPKELCLIGIQPKTIELGLDLTPEIWDKVETLIERMAAKLREWNVPCVLQSPQKSSR